MLVILATSVIMTMGVSGTMPLSKWQAASAGVLGASGEAPQLAVGELMFGGIGYSLMALASVAATLGSLTVAFAAMPRVIYSLARDGNFFGPLSHVFGALHPKYGTPVAATILTVLLYTVPALVSSVVIEWVFSAAYLWIILYGVFHLLAFFSRRQTSETGLFRGRWFGWWTIGGVAVTAATLYFAFYGAHAEFGPRALVLLGVAAVVTAVSYALRNGLRPTIRIARKQVSSEIVKTSAIQNR
ncbi:amino acid permease [candidate division GN15 bacterium]|nr:amino acid permease [candidate division GN15 bacterium]